MKTKHLREVIGLSQLEAAQMQKISLRTLSHWESKEKPEYKDWLISRFIAIESGNKRGMPKRAQELESARRHLYNMLYDSIK